MEFIKRLAWPTYPEAHYKRRGHWEVFIFAELVGPSFPVFSEGCHSWSVIVSSFEPTDATDAVMPELGEAEEQFAMHQFISAVGSGNMREAFHAYDKEGRKSAITTLKASISFQGQDYYRHPDTTVTKKGCRYYWDTSYDKKNITFSQFLNYILAHRTELLSDNYETFVDGV